LRLRPQVGHPSGERGVN